MTTRRRTILLAEDETLLAGLIQTALTERGYSVSCAKTGQEAVGMAILLRPDLILMDLHMPGGTGLDALKKLQTTGNHEVARIPVLILTGDATQDNVLAAGMFGAAGFLSKNNLDMDELARRVEQALSRKAGTPVPGAPLPSETGFGSA